MKNNKTLKFLVCFLAIIFVISILPISIAASSDNLANPDDVEYDTSEEEIDEWESLYSASNTDIESYQEEGTEENSESNPTLPLSPILPKNNGDTAGLYVIDDPSLDNPIEPGSQYVSDGVYALENVGNANFWMEMQNTETGIGARMWQKRSITSPVESFTRSCLFKISRIEGTSRYVIRSMLNNRISFRIIGTEVVGVEIPPDDDDVNIYNTFYITFNSSGYVIKQYGSTYYLTAPPTLVSGSENNTVADLAAGALSSGGNRSKWVFRRYTGADQSGVDVLVSPTSWEYGAKAGTEYLLKLKTWSTKIGANSPRLEFVQTSRCSARDWWDSSTNTLHIIPMGSGSFVIRSSILYDGTDDLYESFDSSCYYVVPDIDGDVAFLQNVGSRKYIEVENASTANGAVIQQYSFHTQPHMKWVFEATNDGFFYIKSLSSNMYLGIDPSNTNLVKQYATKSDYTQWRFTTTFSGNYKITCKATETNETALSTPFLVSSDGTDLMMLQFFEHDEIYYDEWEIYDEPNTYYGELQYWVSDSKWVGYWSDTPTIYIENQGFSEYTTKDYFETGVAYAIQQWEQALDVTFAFVSREEADIRIYFVDKDAYFEKTKENWPNDALGVTWFGLDGLGHGVFDGEVKLIREMEYADIYILYDEEFPLTLSSAKYICTHEFGHAVGYLGHSPMWSDVMYYMVINSELTLSVRDITHLTYINSLLE